MKKHLQNIVGFLLVCVLSVHAPKVYGQVIPQSYFGLQNLSLLNPAAMSVSEKTLEASVSNQSIIQGIEGAPSSTFFNAQGIVNKENQRAYLGLGAVIMNDRIGNFSNVLAQGGVSFHLRNDYQHLSFGVSGGAIRYNFDAAQAIFARPNDPIRGVGINGSSAVIDFGTYYEIAATNRRQNTELRFFTMLGGRWMAGFRGIEETRFPFSFNAMIGQKINVSENTRYGGNKVFTYALEMRKETVLSANVHALFSWRDNLLVGTVLRAENFNFFTAVGWQAGVNLKIEDERLVGVRFAYFMPMGNQLTTRYSQGSIEIGLAYSH